MITITLQTRAHNVNVWENTNVIVSFFHNFFVYSTPLAARVAARKTRKSLVTFLLIKPTTGLLVSNDQT